MAKAKRSYRDVTTDDQPSAVENVYSKFKEFGIKYDAIDDAKELKEFDKLWTSGTAESVTKKFGGAVNNRYLRVRVVNGKQIKEQGELKASKPDFSRYDFGTEVSM